MHTKGERPRKLSGSAGRLTLTLSAPYFEKRNSVQDLEIVMPIYEYRCEHCGSQFEELTSSAGAAQVRCRQCNGRRVTRLLSAFAVGGNGPAAVQPAEAGPCGACGAPQRGMCAAD